MAMANIFLFFRETYSGRCYCSSTSSWWWLLPLHLQLLFWRSEGADSITGFITSALEGFVLQVESYTTEIFVKERKFRSVKYYRKSQMLTRSSSICIK